MSEKIDSSTNSEEIVLLNAAEELVREKAKEVMKKYDMCQCNQCYLDVCAIALNNLKPLYITTHRGRLLSTLRTLTYGYQTELAVQVMKAIEIVKKSPKHG